VDLPEHHAGSVEGFEEGFAEEKEEKSEIGNKLRGEQTG
jgi:hypothetical protein